MRALPVCLLLVMACLGGGAGTQEAAVLNLQVRVDAGVIQVSDLWRNAGQKATAVIGTAPPPGRSFTIEAAQLAYIARLYDVAWKPVSGVERTSVERGGRALERDEVLDPIRRGLVNTGLSETVTLELANFTPIMVPPITFPVVTVEGLSFDSGTERFSANIAVTSDGMEKQTFRVSGRAVQMVDAVVAVRRLQPEDVIAATDVKQVRMPERRVAGEIARTIDQVVGQAARKTITVGQPLAIADIGQPMMIAKGAQVVLTMETPGLSIAAQALAMGSGGRDDMIEVMNPLSRAVVAARVTGPGRAVVVPGSVPVTPVVARSRRGPEVAQ